MLRELCFTANRCDLQFVSTREDPSDGLKKMRKIAQPIRETGRNYRGFNLLDPQDRGFMLRMRLDKMNAYGLHFEQMRRLSTRRLWPC